MLALLMLTAQLKPVWDPVLSFPLMRKQSTHPSENIAQTPLPQRAQTSVKSLGLQSGTELGHGIAAVTVKICCFPKTPERLSFILSL